MFDYNFAFDLDLQKIFGKRAANTIAGYEEYIKDIIQRLKEC